MRVYPDGLTRAQFAGAAFLARAPPGGAGRSGRRRRARRIRLADAGAHATRGLPGPAARAGVRDLDPHDRPRPHDRARAGRIARERGALAAPHLARPAGLRGRAGVHLGQCDGGPPRAPRRALLPGRAGARGRRRAAPAGLLPLLRPRGVGRGLRRHGGLHRRVLQAPGRHVARAHHLRARLHARAGPLARRPGTRPVARGDVLPPRRAALRPRRARRPAVRGVSQRRRRAARRGLLRRLPAC